MPWISKYKESSTHWYILVHTIKYINDIHIGTSHTWYNTGMHTPSKMVWLMWLCLWTCLTTDWFLLGLHKMPQDFCLAPAMNHPSNNANELHVFLISSPLHSFWRYSQKNTARVVHIFTMWSQILNPLCQHPLLVMLLSRQSSSCLKNPLQSWISIQYPAGDNTLPTNPTIGRIWAWHFRFIRESPSFLSDLPTMSMWWHACLIGRASPKDWT